MRYNEYYRHHPVLYEMLPFLKNREFHWGYPKHLNKGQKLKPLHRCNNIQQLDYLLFRKMDIDHFEWNLFTSVARYEKGVPYRIGRDLVDGDDWFKNYWKQIDSFDCFIDVDAVSHDEKDMYYAWKTVDLIMNDLLECHCPFYLRFSGKGFHIIIPDEAFSSEEWYRDYARNSRMHKCYAMIRRFFYDLYSELVDVAISNSTVKIKVPYSVSLYGDKEYVCTPINSLIEFNNFLIEKYTPEKILPLLGSRNQKLFNYKYLSEYGASRLIEYASHKVKNG